MVSGGHHDSTSSALKTFVSTHAAYERVPSETSPRRRLSLSPTFSFSLPDVFPYVWGAGGWVCQTNERRKMKIPRHELEIPNWKEQTDKYLFMYIRRYIYLYMNVNMYAYILISTCICSNIYVRYYNVYIYIYIYIYVCDLYIGEDIKKLVSG